MTHPNQATARARGQRSGRADFLAIGEAVQRHRGRAKELQLLFERTLIPMVWLDNDRRCVDANPASRLFLRRTLDEMRQLSVDDFLLRGPSSELDATWQTLLREGTVAGASPLRAPDGSVIPVDYCAGANLLPGRHLFVWMPAFWDDRELSESLVDDEPRHRGRLTEREREVLGVLATGASVDEISKELALSPHTVKTHLRNAVRRLGAHHRAHAIAIALRDGEI
jgi:DNA-binding NarL/FixJ family response regulator